MALVTDEELSEFVDGRLAEPRRSEVARAVTENAELASRVEGFQDQTRGLHALYDDVLHRPVPDRLLATVRSAGTGGGAAPRQTFQWRQAAAILAVFIVGLGGGWLAKGYLDREPNLLKAVVKQAVLAHQMHNAAVSEQQEALQVAPESFAINAQSNPFDVPLRVPSTVGPSNFVPVSFQSATGAAGPTVQLAYRDEGGEEVTLFVQPHSRTKAVPFATSQEDGFDVLYWIDGPLVYVLVGQSGESDLRKLADSFYGSSGLRPLAEPKPQDVSAQPDD